LDDAAGLAPLIAGADVVFHLAGLTRALHESDLLRVNGEGTWNVAQACAAQAVPPRLVVVSSIAAAGPTPRGTVRSEADPPSPISAYGRSKRAGELAARAWADRVPTTVIRSAIVFGPWGRELLPMFRSVDRLGIHPIPTFVPPPLSLFEVSDLVRLLLAAAERGSRLEKSPADHRASRRLPGYYFACARQHPTYTELGRMIARAVGRRHVFLFHLGEPLPWLAAGVVEAFAHLRHKADLIGIDKMTEATASSWACSPDAAGEDLGVAAEKPLQQGLCETAQWYRRRRWL
jgi:nucleoside-diphosphate-sugar epimerase